MKGRKVKTASHVQQIMNLYEPVLVYLKFIDCQKFQKCLSPLFLQKVQEIFEFFGNLINNFIQKKHDYLLAALVVLWRLLGQEQVAGFLHL